jgi:ankyrin repeat protein
VVNFLRKFSVGAIENEPNKSIKSNLETVRRMLVRSHVATNLEKNILSLHIYIWFRNDQPVGQPTMNTLRSKTLEKYRTVYRPLHIVDHGMDSVSREPIPDTELCIAIDTHNTTKTLSLIENGANLNALSGPSRSTPLKLATAHGDLRVMEALLDAGADVDRRDDATGLTALFFAAQAGNGNAARILILHGADVSAKNCNGSTPLHFAISGPLAPTSEDRNAMVSLLMRYGADVNAYSNRHHVTVLMHAVDTRAPGVVDVLLNATCHTKLRIDDADDEGRTALHRAILHPGIEIVKLLLLHGASIDVKDGSGRTVTELAVLWGNNERATRVEKDISRLLRDVEERVLYRSLQRVAAMGGHSRAVDSPFNRLPPGMLSRIFERDGQQQTDYDRFVDDVVTSKMMASREPAATGTLLRNASLR